MRSTGKSILAAQAIGPALPAPIPARVSKGAASAKVIVHETAIFEGAFHEATSGEGATPEFAALKPDANEGGDIGQRQVQVTLAKCAVKESRGDVQTLALDAPELAELKELFLPRDIFRKTSFKDLAGDLHPASFP